MSDLLTNSAVCLATIVLLVVAAERFMAPARLMGLTLFRPWRGDGWPVGVQEDDDARFNWATADAAPRVPGRTGRRRRRSPSVEQASGPDNPASTDPPDGLVIDELDEGAAVEAVPVSRVAVHGAGR